MTSCHHETSEPVTLISGEEVARVCVECLDRLPVNWGCTDCDWVEITSFSDIVAVRVPGRPCRLHAKAFR